MGGGAYFITSPCQSDITICYSTKCNAVCGLGGVSYYWVWPLASCDYHIDELNRRTSMLSVPARDQCHYNTSCILVTVSRHRTSCL